MQRDELLKFGLKYGGWQESEKVIQTQEGQKSVIGFS